MVTETYLREESGWRSLRYGNIVAAGSALEITHGSQINEFNTGWKRFGLPLRTVLNNESEPGQWKVENGAFYALNEGTVIEGLDINFPVVALASHITFRRCRMASGGFYLLKAADIPTYYTHLTVEDCELFGNNIPDPPSVASLACEYAVFRRCNIWGFGSSGPRLTNHNLLEECYIHDFVHAEPNHEAGTSANGPDVDVTIQRCKITINSGGASCAVGIYLDFGSHDGVYIYDNYMEGGAYVLQAGIRVPGAPHPSSQNVEVIGNVFGRNFNPYSGIYGPVSQWRNDPGCIWSNNTWGGGVAATSEYVTGEQIIAFAGSGG